VFKRLRWFVMGAVVGSATTLWGLTFARSKARQLAPASVAGAVGARARDRWDDLRDALFEGRLAMREREVELRTELDRGRAEAADRPALTLKSSPN
jgi:hypothetical protein